jgi:sporadic carbohydrate cluster protein (TIGR04323 family)
MENGNSWLGYIFSDDRSINFVPQKVQNLVIRDYLSKISGEMILSTTEYNLDSNFISLRSALEDKKAKNILFYSIDLLPLSNKELMSQMFELITSKQYKIGFALEELIIQSAKDLEELLLIRSMKYSIPKNQEATPREKIPFRDLRVVDRELRANYLNAINKVFDSGVFIEGNELEEFESNLSNYIGARYSLGVSSGTDALYLALKGLEIGPGDEVIIPCMSWISTAHAVSSCGAEVVFADIKDDLTIDPDSIKTLVTPKTKAVVAVHFMGNICDIESIKSIAPSLKIIEDCAQSFGATFKKDKAGNLGDISCFSFNPMKGLSSFGEAGAICTDDQNLFKRIKVLRYCGVDENKDINVVSLNYRMDTIWAAILNESLKAFEYKTISKERVYNFYFSRLSNHFKIISGNNDNPGSKYGFTILVDNREHYISQLDKAKIETRIHHVPLMCDYKVYSKSKALKKNGDELSKKILNLPLHEKLTSDQLDFIVLNLISIKEELSSD